MKQQKKQNQIERPPVVVILGHIDHGKSTLLDYIRQTKITANEAGGITQAVGAYEVTKKTKDGKERRLTFIDTPGHEAFVAARERGARIADIAVLVVSVEDGPKPQTLECHKILTELKLPFLIAINKVDKASANVERVKQQLAEKNILLEGYGGQISSVSISAQTGEGVEELLELLLLTADLAGFVGDPKKQAEGFVLESKRDPRTGCLATLIIKDGTLENGDCVVIEGVVSKVRRIKNFLGEDVTSLSFSSPAQIIGFSSAPSIGAGFKSFSCKTDAESYTKTLSQETANVSAKKTDEINEESAEDVIEIPVVIKTDVSGSIEAIKHEVQKLETERIKIKVLTTGAGPVNENDVKLTSGATAPIVLGFNVGVERGAEEAAEKLGATIATFDIIYKLSEWLLEEITRRLPKSATQTLIGQAKILKTFSQVKNKQVIGGQVEEGVIAGGKSFRISRDEKEVGTGKVVNLQQNKEQVRSVAGGNQFGAMVTSQTKIEPGDILEFF